MKLSIGRRLLVSTLLILVAFLGLAGVALDRAFRSSAESATNNQLQAHVYTLLAAAEPDERGRMRLPAHLAAPAFNRPLSGLYAEVQGEDGYRWRSGSLLTRSQPLLQAAAPGKRAFRSAEGLAVLDQGISWEDDSGKEIRYTLTVAIDRAPIERQQSAFRVTLWQWLGGVAMLLLLVQVVLVRWGLRPLHDMSAAVRRLERGESTRIDGPVATELQSLSDNLNALIQLSQNRQTRVRNSLADLAHSMKTPLAVLRGAAEKMPADDIGHLINEQSRRIDDIVSYQRQRAAVAGGSGVTRPIAVQPIIERLCTSLDKVFQQRAIVCELDLEVDLRLRADEGDLFELFGNLLENAYKHCDRAIIVAGRGAADSVILSVEDDGCGIAESDSERLLRRGERADQHHPGEGIGLAVANEIVHQYGGKLSILRSSLGGAKLRIALPG